MMIEFESFTENLLPIFYQWAIKEHAKNTWFIEGYEPENTILEKIKGNGYDYPFIIHVDDRPIGYIQYSDLYAYKTICPDPKGVFTNDDLSTLFRTNF